MIRATAAGKVILCGEHSVVYGRPAIAVPVSSLRTTAEVQPLPPGSGVHLIAQDLHEQTWLRETTDEHPLGKATRLVLARLQAAEPDAELTLRSDLPIAAGLGSGAAAAVAAIRAWAQFLGHPFPPSTVSELAYEVEKLHHGTPSGIDNSVVAWEQPIYFIKGLAPQPFRMPRPLHLLIADSGVRSATGQAVAEVRRRWQATTAEFEAYFNAIAEIAAAARTALTEGNLPALGPLLNENHRLLRRMGVSLPALDALVQAARAAGASGAKLTGGGMGGNIIALVTPATQETVRQALLDAGAVRVWTSTHSTPR